MNTQHFPEMATTDGANAANLPVGSGGDARSPAPEKRTLLLISDDAVLHQNLRWIAGIVCRTVVRVDRVAGAPPIIAAIGPEAILLDLDLPEEVAWNSADSLLLEETCPPVILLTGRSEQFDVRTAIRAGSLVDKSVGPSRLLEVVDHTLREPRSNQVERNAIQRVLIRWLKPCGWSIPVTAAHRFWGINE